MIKVTYLNGKEDIFNTANDWEVFGDNDNVVIILKHKYDADGDFDEDDDKTFAWIWQQQIRKIEKIDKEE